MRVVRHETGPRMSQVVIHGNTVYLAGVVAMSLIFGTSALLTNVLVHMHHFEWAQFFLEGDGFSHMFRYFVVTIMACAAG